MMRIPKPLLEEFGGGMQEFTLKDVSAISFILEDLCHFRSSSFDRKSQQLSVFEDSHPVFSSRRPPASPGSRSSPSF